MFEELKILKSKFFIYTLFCILLLYLITFFFSSGNTEYEENLQNIKQTSYFDKEKINQFEVLFCPSTSCKERFIETLNTANNQIYCSFFDISEQEVIITLENLGKTRDIQIIIDNLNTVPLKNIRVFSDHKRNTLYDNYMHHKFCVLDQSLVIVGSANPTENGFLKNDNAILIINSSLLAQNFLNEFYQLRAGSFGYHKKPYNWYNNVQLQYNNRSLEVSSYFCPQDNCMDIVIESIDQAQEELLFASFALTYDDLEEKIVEKDSIRRVGIIEERFVDIKGSRIRELANKFPIIISEDSLNMHHKFFIIDEETVIIGSMNPSNSGAHYNDEFILVIKDRQIAKIFKAQFIRILQRESG